MVDEVVIGGANIDIKAKSNSRNTLGTSNPGVMSFTPGGVGRNISHNLAILGTSVALISIVGDDAFGQIILDATARAGVDVSSVGHAALPTGAYVATLDGDGELVTAINDMRAIEALTPEYLEAHFSVLDRARLVVADCNLPLATLKVIAARVSDRLVIETVSVPKCRKLLDVLASYPMLLSLPNFDQIEHLAGTRDIAAAFAFLHGKGLANAVLHAGAEGAFVSDGQVIRHVPAMPPGNIVDVTGAGDAAVAGLLYGLLQGKSLVEAAVIGQAKAGQVIASSNSTLE